MSSKRVEMRVTFNVDEDELDNAIREMEDWDHTWWNSSGRWISLKYDSPVVDGNPYPALEGQ